MKIKRIGTSVITAMAGLLLTVPSYAGKPDITREMMVPFDFVVVNCDTFLVKTSGYERDTFKEWYDKSGELVRLQISIHITESQYYNASDPDKFVTQGKKGVGEGISWFIDFITGDEHQSGNAFRLTIPGIGHVFLDVGTWFWDASEEVLVHHGPDYALAQGETGLALCEALE